MSYLDRASALLRWRADHCGESRTRYRFFVELLTFEKQQTAAKAFVLSMEEVTQSMSVEKFPERLLIDIELCNIQEATTGESTRKSIKPTWHSETYSYGLWRFAASSPLTLAILSAFEECGNGAHIILNVPRE